jgi:hypothetical protein
MKKILLFTALLSFAACSSGKLESQDVPGAERTQVVTDPGRLERHRWESGHALVWDQHGLVDQV